MATEAIQPSWWHRTVTFVRDAFYEVRHRTTWPDMPQVRNASFAIIVFVLIVAAAITLMDIVMRLVLQQGIPSLFR
jgi:preprotein translocase SecE subunit